MVSVISDINLKNYNFVRRAKSKFARKMELWSKPQASEKISVIVLPKYFYTKSIGKIRKFTKNGVIAAILKWRQNPTKNKMASPRRSRCVEESPPILPC